MHSTATAARPNVLYVVTDDETMRDMNPLTMPHTYADLISHGTTYTDSSTSYAYCCPSRASFQTGEYPQNHGTLGCDAPYGFQYFITHRKVGDTLPEWLRAAGYSTGFTGKYINGNEYVKAPIPRGWSEWHGFGPGTYDYAQQTEVIARNGKRVGTRVHHEYTTRTTGDITTRLVATLSQKRSPWFIEAAFVAPHYGDDHLTGSTYSVVSPGVDTPYRWTFANRAMPRTAAYNQADVSGMNSYMRSLPLISPTLQAQEQRAWQRRQEALRSVDDQVHRLYLELAAHGQLRNTAIVFTSDNGYDLGEHRHVQGKLTPYESSVNVPLVIRWPGYAAATTRRMPVQTEDVTATIAQLAHARTPATVDGISLLPSRADPSWQMNRAVLLRQWLTFPFEGTRTASYTYVHFLGGDRKVELYDHRVDPYETRNVADDPLYAGVVAELARVTALQVGCHGASCRVDTSAESMVSLASARADWAAR